MSLKFGGTFYHLCDRGDWSWCQWKRGQRRWRSDICVGHGASRLGMVRLLGDVTASATAFPSVFDISDLYTIRYHFFHQGKVGIYSESDL